MKPEAIRDSAIELINLIEKSETPANEVINAYTRARRYIGSKDRRTLTDLVWGYVRHRMRLNYLYPDADVKTKLIALQNGIDETIPDAPFHINMEVPEWLVSEIENAEQELPALLETAPIVLRANGDREKIRQMLLSEGIETEKTRLSPYGLILKKRANIQGLSAYRSGLVEIQDEGSQCVALETEVRPGMHVLDYCAGAGGKSLILDQMMNNQGKIVAHDISERSLAELKKRAERAGATCIQIQKPLRDLEFDHVVVDAPCSGTGTWRRCPDMRWKLTPEQVKRLIDLQGEILDRTARYVRQGRFLSYMTCSLIRRENIGQAEMFLKNHSDFSLLKTKQFSPALTGTDGLFVAVFQKKNR